MGNLLSLYDQTVPPPARYTADDIPDLTGKVVIVTGGNAGVGKETVRVLLTHNAKVYMASRDKDRAGQAIAELKEKTGKEAIYLALDLSSFKSIEAAARDFLSKENELHILFNNAGVMFPPIKQLTAEGYDLQFGTNCLGHFYFTKLLLPTLTETAKSSPDGKVRVVNLSSAAHFGYSLDLGTFRDSRKRRFLGSHLMYSQSKFANVVFNRELARRYGDKGVVAIAVHPGTIKTDLFRHTPRFLTAAMEKMFLKPVELGAITPLWAGCSTEAADHNGKYAIPWARLGKARTGTANPQLGEKLWNWLEEQVSNRPALSS